MASKPPFLRKYTEDEAETIALRQVQVGQNVASVGDALRQLDAVIFSGRARPAGPTEYPPGSLGKLAVMHWRAERRESLFQRRDALLESRSVRNAAAAAGDPKKNGSSPLRVLRTVDEHAYLCEEEQEALERAEERKRYDEIARLHVQKALAKIAVRRGVA